MSNKIQLNVNEPCNENWDKMTPVEQGRFCQSCQTTVTDFSLMSDQEILEHLSQREAKVCGRFSNDQLNRHIIQETPRRFSFSYAWNLLLAGVLTAGTAEGQVKITKPVKQKEQVKHVKVPEHIVMGLVADVPSILNTIKGQVLDAKTQTAIPGASIQLKESLAGASTNENGQFATSVELAGKYVTFQVSAIGYAPQELQVRNDTTGLITIYLDKEAVMLDTVFVRTNKNLSELTSVVAGGLMVTRHISYTEKTKRKIDTWTPEVIKKKEVKLFPNPARPGSVVTVTLDLKVAGTYLLEVLDERGQVVHRQQVNLESLTQNVQLTTGAAWSHGTYWVRVYKTGSSKVYNAKMVVI